VKPEGRIPPLTQFLAALGSTPEERRETMALFAAVLPLLESEDHGVPEELANMVQGSLCIAAVNIARAKEAARMIQSRRAGRA
jgi:hypothetical protein